MKAEEKEEKSVAPRDDHRVGWMSVVLYRKKKYSRKK
jgi:hypothetical protein